MFPLCWIRFLESWQSQTLCYRRTFKHSKNDDAADTLSTIDSKLSKIEDVSMKIMQVNSNLQLPLGLSTLLLDAFKCHICHSSPLDPPAMFARCCNRILGCRRCVDNWYKGEEGPSRKCPLCRNDRGFTDTAKLLGLDDLLLAVKGVVNEPVAIHHVPLPPQDID